MQRDETHNEVFEAVGVVVGCLIKLNGKYLLVQEVKSEDYGLWIIPAGHVDKGESLEASAMREAKEESGYDVKIIQEVALIHETASKTVKHVFEAQVVGGELMPREGEILDAKWLTYDEVKALNQAGKLRRPWVWDVIRKDETQ